MRVYDIPIDGSRREQAVYDPGFPVSVYRMAPAANRLGYVNWHWHAEAQYCLVTEGRIAFHVGEATHILGAGQGIFIGGGCLHMIRAADSEQDSYICIDMDPKLLAGSPGSLIEAHYITPYMGPDHLISCPLTGETDWERRLLADIEAAFCAQETAAPAYELDLLGILARMWKITLQHIFTQAARETSRAMSERLKAIFNFIHDHYTEKLTLEDIAQAVHLSRSECCRFFKQATGESLFGYLLDYRLDRSLELLNYTDRSVSEIAFEVGFGSVSYYIASFRERTGQTPGAYRKGP